MPVNTDDKAALECEIARIVKAVSSAASIKRDLAVDLAEIEAALQAEGANDYGNPFVQKVLPKRVVELIETWPLASLRVAVKNLADRQESMAGVQDLHVMVATLVAQTFNDAARRAGIEWAKPDGRKEAELQATIEEERKRRQRAEAATEAARNRAANEKNVALEKSTHAMANASQLHEIALTEARDAREARDALQVDHARLQARVTDLESRLRRLRGGDTGDLFD